jgi:hypothetical protein
MNATCERFLGSVRRECLVEVTTDDDGGFAPNEVRRELGAELRTARRVDAPDAGLCFELAGWDPAAAFFQVERARRPLHVRQAQAAALESSVDSPIARGDSGIGFEVDA